MFLKSPILGENNEFLVEEALEEGLFRGQVVWYHKLYICSNRKIDEKTVRKIQRENEVRIVDAYRTSEGLLTSEEIRSIRRKYGLSAEDFATILDFGLATIKRYELNFVQNRSYDTIIRYADTHPQFVLECLDSHQDRISKTGYRRASEAIKEMQKDKE